MNLTYILIIVIICLLIVIGAMTAKSHRARKKSKQILTTLDDIQQGNLNRRILADSSDLTADICYKVNEIALTFKEQLSQAAITEQTNGQIMTSLSHDVRTPLTTLIGYLDAIQSQTVTGEEREQYIERARTKAYAIKDYTDDLFDWFKINSNEKVYHFEAVDINELSRNIIIDWIPQFERAGLSYDIEILEKELSATLDVSSYNRILNNLIQNSIKHSKGSRVGIAIKDCGESVLIEISDNGAGIPADDLPHLFERLYKCDEARTTSSSGLGLSIVYELVKAHGGTVFVESIPNVKTVFTVRLKKTR